MILNVVEDFPVLSAALNLPDRLLRSSFGIRIDEPCQETLLSIGFIHLSAGKPEINTENKDPLGLIRPETTRDLRIHH